MSKERDMPKDKDEPFAMVGRPTPNSLRRMQRIASTPLFKLVAVLLLVLLGIRWVSDYGRDREDWPGVVRPTTSVESWWVNWDEKQYIQIVADEENLCSAVLTWFDMEQIGSRARRTLVYPSTWSPDEAETDTALNTTLTRKAHLLREARDKYYVRLHPIDTLNENDPSRAIWTDPYIKLLAFNLTQFSRVLVLDSASQLKGNLDAVFLIPKAILAMPWVYWGGSTGWAFSNQMMLITPSASEFAKIEAEIKKPGSDTNGYDLSIAEKLYSRKTLKIPQRPYHLMTGELRLQDHSKYLGSGQNWDAQEALQKSKMLHFSDWPIPRPWDGAPQAMLNKYMPKCLKSEWFGATDCQDRMAWMQLYADYAAKRKGFCGSHFEVEIRDQKPDAMVRNGRFFHDGET
ncbi:hypothetical protein VTL71DRAFT_7909 [Oculimacula yallundae]|uniref:Uncharacterized protein n=1 Tax=Oculimacula yallundae TaxID=86028 RepID=A0ABR4CYC8_9HELO